MPRFSRWALLLVVGTALVAHWSWIASGSQCVPATAAAESSEPSPRDERDQRDESDDSESRHSTLTSESDESSDESRHSALRASALRATGTEPTCAEPQESGVPELDARAVEDILRLRSDQGSLFEGTVFEELGDPAAETEFLEALRGAAQSASSASGRSATATCPPEDVARWRDMQLVVTLRQAGRQLEGKAADLEEDRQYEDADRLRRLAQALWKEARGIAAAPIPPAQASPGPVPQ